jgi:hypothetical protein
VAAVVSTVERSASVTCSFFLVMSDTVPPCGWNPHLADVTRRRSWGIDMKLVPTKIHSWFLSLLTTNGVFFDHLFQS